MGLDPEELDPQEEAAAPDPPPFGPYDVAQAPDDEIERADFGSLRIPVLHGVEIRFDAQTDGQIHRIMLVHGNSGLELAAFAAPRSDGIWDEVRTELGDTLTGRGAKPQEARGEYGVELLARVREDDGPVDLRIVGVDGPRWFVLATYRGAAALDPDRAGRLQEALHGVVVNRGSEAMPVNEPLPLRLPPGAAARIARMSATRGKPRSTATLAAAAPATAPDAAPTAAPDARPVREPGGAADGVSGRPPSRRPASRRRGR